MEENKNLVGKVIEHKVNDLKLTILLNDKLKVGDKIMIKKDDKQASFIIKEITVDGINVDKGFDGDIIEIAVENATEQLSDGLVYKI
ncbi:MAG: hypothetical protein QXD11_00850 [Candidatus Micrarchaeaceae archaeon]